MKVNSFNKVSTVISLLDKHILNIIRQKEIDDDKLSVLTDIRTLYVEELNGIIRGENMSDMYDKNYWKSYRRSNW